MSQPNYKESIPTYKNQENDEYTLRNKGMEKDYEHMYIIAKYVHISLLNTMVEI